MALDQRNVKVMNDFPYVANSSSFEILSSNFNTYFELMLLAIAENLRLYLFEIYLFNL